MKRKIFYLLFIIAFVFSLQAYACGDNPNAIIQGPFKTDLYENGLICFQNSIDKRNIDFYASFKKDGVEFNKKIDTFNYSDAPVELLSVFFSQISKSKDVVVLLRWNVNYGNNDKVYNYYYEIRTYKKYKDGYKINLNANIDPNLSGYQITKDNKVTDYPLNNASKIKLYLKAKYSS